MGTKIWCNITQKTQTSHSHPINSWIYLRVFCSAWVIYIQLCNLFSFRTSHLIALILICMLKLTQWILVERRKWNVSGRLSQKQRERKEEEKKKNHNLAHLSVSVKAVKSISPTKPQYFLAMAFNDARKAVELQRLCNLHKNSNLFLMLLHPLLAVSFLPPPTLIFIFHFFLNPLSRHNKHSKDFFLTKVEKTAGI